MFFTVIPTKIDRGWKLILMNSVNRSVPSVVVRVMFRMLLAVVPMDLADRVHQ